MNIHSTTDSTIRRAAASLAALLFISFASVAQELWPDGTARSEWFATSDTTPLEQLGTPFRLTDHGVEAGDSTLMQTAAIQRVIDLASANDRPSVVVVPRGVYLTGALFLRPRVNIYLEEGARLKGSDNILDFPLVETRIEGQTCLYFAALINADRCDGIHITGRGTVDGNGWNYWKAFWIRRAWNPACTNKDEQRPRLIYLSRCRDAEISGLTLQNSPFWTTHLFRCERVRLHGLRILSPAGEVKAPSTDAIDLDACTDIHVARCYMAVNDDAIALKGGKGPLADRSVDNGANERILIEDCDYGFCHSCLTCGSEAVSCRNIVLRRTRVGKAERLLWLKMRPDTPQHYEHIAVSGVTGSVTHFLYVYPWTQFFDLQGQAGPLPSSAAHITMSDCRMACRTVLNVRQSEQYTLDDFHFERLHLTARSAKFDTSVFGSATQRDVTIEAAH